MAHLMGEGECEGMLLDFGRRLKLELHGSKVTSDAGLLPFRELDDALGLTETAGDRLVDPRTGKNGQHGMANLFRQSTFGRLGGYEDVNNADRLGHDPATAISPLSLPLIQRRRSTRATWARPGQAR